MGEGGEERKSAGGKKQKQSATTAKPLQLHVGQPEGWTIEATLAVSDGGDENAPADALLQACVAYAGQLTCTSG